MKLTSTLLIKITGFGFIALSLSLCTHFDWGKTGAADDDTPPPPSEDELAASEPLETVVEYEPGREPAEPRGECTAENTEFRLHYAPGYTPDLGIRAKAENVRGSLSIEEKIEQMSGTVELNDADIFRQPHNKTQGIRGFEFRDGPRGLNLDAELMTGHEGYSTAFPVSMSRGASFDLDLEYKIGKAQGDETLASRNTLMLAPTVNLLRHPAWGRAQETYGEDPFLLGRMSTAYTLGVQYFIPTCIKHYVANNVEDGRGGLNSTMDEQTLREIYGRAYDMAINDGGVSCVMAAYNLLNGEKCTENAHILTDVLRDDFKFEGFVLSDWWAMTNGKNTGLSSGTYSSVGAAGVSAGLDMELPWRLNYRYIDGAAEAADINRSVDRILEQKYRFKVVDLNDSKIGLNTPTTTFDVNTSNIQNNQAHLALAEEAARKGAVLLKNDNQTLPIPETVSTIAVLGVNIDYFLQIYGDLSVNFATQAFTGDLGSSRVRSNPEQSVSPLAGIEAKAAAKGIDVISGTSAAEASGADFVVVVAGLHARDEGEEYTGAGDRTDFALDSKIDGTPQIDLINDAAVLGKPMVVVLIGGSAIDLPWLSSVPAVLMAWYPGMTGGGAIADLLFGNETPGGKLPFTWPAAWSDAPEFAPGTDIPMEYYAGYRYYEEQGIEPLFPFGHGLSYTEFEYLNLEVPCTTVTGNMDTTIKVMVDVSNRGTVAGDEVAFLWVSYPESDDPRRRAKQLKAFYRVHLKVGQTKQILLPIRMKDMKFFNMQTEQWEIEKGPMEISVGSSAATILMTDNETSVI